MSKRDEDEMNRLAEEVAAHGSLARAGRKLKMSVLRRDVLWMRICARLGSQAA